MSIEQLMKLSKAELQKLADEKDISYVDKMTKEELAQLIHAENTKTERPDQIKVRVRVVPNKGIISRIRSGMMFGVQYSEHEIDEGTFNRLKGDQYLQVEPLNE